MTPYQRMQWIADSAANQATGKDVPMPVRATLHWMAETLRKKEEFHISINLKTLCRVGRIIQHTLGIVADATPNVTWDDGIEAALGKLLTELGCPK